MDVVKWLLFHFQMELGHSKANTGYLVEELAAKQPLAIAFLKQYLALPTSFLIQKQISATSSTHGGQNRKSGSEHKLDAKDDSIGKGDEESVVKV